MYKIKELAELSGVSTRTLRYYDSIDLLKPSKLSDSGYRLYSEYEVKILQQILFLKELDFSLKEIKNILNSHEENQLSSFTHQYQALLNKKDQLNDIILLMEKTIQEKKGRISMSDKERFSAFKNQQLEKNREIYGREIENKYGTQQLKYAEEKFSNLNQKELLTDMVEIESQLLDNLKDKPTIPSEKAELIYLLHQKWLSFTLDLTPELHQSLVEMYLADDRFVAYYDSKSGIGATKKLHDITQFYTKRA